MPRSGPSRAWGRRLAEWLLGLWMVWDSRSSREAPPTADELARETWRTQVGPMGVRWTDRLRDALRRTWLRLVDR